MGVGDGVLYGVEAGVLMVTFPPEYSLYTAAAALRCSINRDLSEDCPSTPPTAFIIMDLNNINVGESGYGVCCNLRLMVRANS